ncbi:MAG: cytochrome c oxidase subunit II [Verrucomicrobia bacterium]|nr:cytochrome c oxidase subunit II [Verrucomicrobiota bacterium]
MRLTSFLKTLLRWELAVLLVSGCLTSLAHASDKNFFVMDGHQSTIFVDGSVARSQNTVFYTTCAVTFVIFVLVAGTLAYATIKFKARSAADEHAEPPPQSHGNPLVEIALIAASVFALVIIAIPTLKSIWYTHDVPAEEKAKGNAYEVNAIGYQWWFKFEYPSVQINGAGTLVTANELVIPAGQPVRVNVRTTDVIHSFWVPKLAGKVDMIPNRANYLWLQADKPGYYWGQCAEYCGDSHAVMRFRVIALGPKEFNEWLDGQVAPARSVSSPVAASTAAKPQFASLRKPDSYKTNEAGITTKFDVNPLEAWRAKQFPEKNEDPALVGRGKELFKSKTCQNCHAIRGHGPLGVTAPDLTHFGSRTTLAAGLLENNTEQLHRWIHHPGAVKPGNKMQFGIGGMAGYQKKDDKGHWTQNIALTTDEELALVAYLESLK